MKDVLLFFRISAPTRRRLSYSKTQKVRKRHTKLKKETYKQEENLKSKTTNSNNNNKNKNKNKNNTKWYCF